MSNKYYIIPVSSFKEEIEASSPEEAMEKFAWQMDSDMNNYFKAIPEEPDGVLQYRIISENFDKIEKLFDEKGIDYDYDTGDRMMVNLEGMNALDESDIDFNQVA